MLDTQEFGKLLKDIGVEQFSGVPCSYLAPLINYAINENKFIMSNNEGDAVAIASGISLASKNIGCVLMQNSGLSNALSPLTSLNHTFKIPILGFVSLRGKRDENNKNTDEPQHELLGVITDKLLEICEIKYEFLDFDIKKAKIQIKHAKKILDSNQSFFFIVQEGTFCKVPLNLNPLDKSNIVLLDSKKMKSSAESTIPSRLEALRILHNLAFRHNALLFATTGKCGRELYEIADNPNQFYMVGSMGCVSSLSLGIALASKHKVIAIDGDSALLMRLGNLSTNAYYAKNRNLGNFCHILLDNQSHDSTGGQFNLSPFVDFASIAESCGYDKVNIAYNLNDFQKYINLFLEANTGGAHFIYLAIKKGSKENLGRPKILPQDVAKRLSNFLSL